ncbi:unnamed protein product [Periconia digitata]|uniref:C2H2-type domain-containing protein n=1 Tax=Periconia digitata TaxID=1303443 RepID=A0A9W4U2W6_9PLEO|nr:unnamed protein product [Periconia digitata]
MNTWTTSSSSNQVVASGDDVPQAGLRDRRQQVPGRFFPEQPHPYHFHLLTGASENSFMDGNQIPHSLVYPWSPLNPRIEEGYQTTLPIHPAEQNHPTLNVPSQTMLHGGLDQSHVSHHRANSMTQSPNVFYEFGVGQYEYPPPMSEPSLEDVHDINDQFGAYPRSHPSSGGGGHIPARSMTGQLDSEANDEYPRYRHDNSEFLQAPSRDGSSSPSSSRRIRASSTTIPDELECTIDDCNARFHGEYRKSNLARHYRLRHDRGGRTYVCEGGCDDKVFKRQDARLKHYRRKHQHLALPAAVPRKG